MDFYQNVDISKMWDSADDGNGLAAIMSSPRGLDAQRGAFPQDVAWWLRGQLEEVGYNITITTNNNWQDPETSSVAFNDIFKNLAINNSDVDMINLPDMGYNVSASANYDTEEIDFITLGRKADPDLTISFVSIRPKAIALTRGLPE